MFGLTFFINVCKKFFVSFIFGKWRVKKDSAKNEKKYSNIININRFFNKYNFGTYKDFNTDEIKSTLFTISKRVKP